MKLESILNKDTRYALITDSNVERLHAKTLVERLCQQGYDVTLFSFPAGEKYKTRETKHEIEEQMFQKRFGRDTVVIGMGGGVVTDMAGFIAATYCRGVALIYIPTTLLAMVDASLGGKTGVNVPQGKNMIGAFYPARHCIIDESYLKTLPEQEMKNGYAEIIKYGLISSKNLFNQIGTAPISELIVRSRIIKEHIVEEDPLEHGIRRTLNFGHTIGHALETILDYQISHGEAVAAGMLMESYLSAVKPEEYDAIRETLKNYSFPKVSISELMEAIGRDKKALKSKARFVLLEGIGSTHSFNGHYCTHVDEKLIHEAHEYFSH